MVRKKGYDRETSGTLPISEKKGVGAIFGDWQVSGKPRKRGKRL